MKFDYSELLSRNEARSIFVQWPQMLFRPRSPLKALSTSAAAEAVVESSTEAAEGMSVVYSS